MNNMSKYVLKKSYIIVIFVEKVTPHGTSSSEKEWGRC